MRTTEENVLSGPLFPFLSDEYNRVTVLICGASDEQQCHTEALSCTDTHNFSEGFTTTSELAAVCNLFLQQQFLFFPFFLDQFIP